MLAFLKYNLFNSQRNQLILIVILTSLVFLNSLSNRILWDDHLFLENWPSITSWNNIGEILQGSSPPAQDKIYRPLRGIFWLVDYQIFGTNPFFYHLQALGIHVVVTVLIYLITFQIIFRIDGGNSIKYQVSSIKGKNKNPLNTYPLILIPFLTALFFGIHPIHTETINYISASLETFGSLFFFISFYLYLRFSELPQKTKYYLKEASLMGSVVFAGMAFFTYEMALTLPVLIVIYELIIGRVRFNLKSWGKRIYPLVGIVLVALVYLLIRIVVFKITARTDYLAYSFYKTMLVMVQVFVKYIGLLILPINQTAIHNLVGEFPSSMIPYDKLDPIQNLTILDTPVLLSIVTLGLLIAVAVKFRNQYPLISFSIAWFFISLLPVSFIIPGGGAMAEKYLYIPSFGFLLGTVYLGYLLYEYGKSRVSRAFFSSLHPQDESRGFQLAKVKNLEFIVTIGVIIIAGAFSFLTTTRNAVWKDDISLFTDVVKKSPNNLIANYTLGIWYGKFNYFDQAQFYYQKAIEKAPEFWEARFNLANLFIKQSKFDEAKAQLTTITQMYENHTLAKNMLANLDLVKESTSSATASGEILVNYTKKPNFNFSFPAIWSIDDQGEKIVLKDPNQILTVEIEEPFDGVYPGLRSGAQGEDIPVEEKTKLYDSFLNSQVESTTSGKLSNQGLAGIPNVELAYVKAYELNGQTRLQFYLFQGLKVIKVMLFPVSAPDLMAQFDLILGSVKIND